MYILIDLERETVELADPNDVKRFHLAIAHGASDTVAEQVLESTKVGRLDPDDDDHAWISVGTVRRLAIDRVGPTWSRQFDAMLAKAAQHGFYDEHTQEIKAHVEWITAEQEITGFEATD